MSKLDQLKYGPPGESALHICVDMQRMFAENTDWHMPWFARVVPNVTEIVAARPESTLFTRFIPAQAPGQGRGMWKRYYERWPSMTAEALGMDMIDLVPTLARFTPPAHIFDKHVYSPWTGTNLHLQLHHRKVDTVIITGGETDICVLGTVLGAIDWGFRVILVTDALCSSANATHDAMMEIYRNRFGQQIETVLTDVLLKCWTR